MTIVLLSHWVSIFLGAFRILSVHGFQSTSAYVYVCVCVCVQIKFIDQREKIQLWT